MHNSIFALVPLSVGMMRPSDNCVHFTESSVCFFNTPFEVPREFYDYYLVEEDQNATYADYTAEACQSNAPWHLGRTNQPSNNQRTIFSAPNTAPSVDIYIVDTWTDCSHSDFAGGRCQVLKDFARDKSNKTVHGTLTASLAAGKRFGAAKDAHIYNVQVLGEDGHGAYSDIIKGLEYIQSRILAQRPQRRLSLINLSLGGGKSEILDKVVEEIFVGNIAIPVIAAGNENQDACQKSPTSRILPNVAATDFYQQPSDFSNYGPCVTMNAPGSNIQSACPGEKTCWYSGTSLSAPITAGTLAVYWEQFPKFTTTELWLYARSKADTKSIKNRKRGTTNRFNQLADNTQCFWEEEFILQE